MRHTACQWIEGEPSGDDGCKCLRGTERGESWCPAHLERIYLPPDMAEKLYARAPQDKQLYWIPGADHNNGFIVGGGSYRQALQQAIAQWTGFTAGIDP